MKDQTDKTKKATTALDLNNVHLKVYNKIALWNNEDCDDVEKGKRLRFVAHEVIQDVLDDVFEQLDVKTSTGIVAGEVKKKKIQVTVPKR